MKISITEFIIAIALLIGLALGVSTVYERVLVSLTQTTAEKISRR